MPGLVADEEELNLEPDRSPCRTFVTQASPLTNSDPMARPHRFWARAPTHPIIEITKLSTFSEINDEISIVRRPNTAATIESDTKTIIGNAGWSKHKLAEPNSGQVDEDIAYRKLLRQLDIIILPLTALLYLSAYLNRGNLGNALLYGLRTDALGNSDLHYSLVLCRFRL
ncbi:hypothetical protein CROQUDRAFT_91012 [Cronartium quercuum f. sp. fusiforme G11]|uniref:Uncharacterized protein n=1 Tax=Cronartium quercuum f. sp. fusiforme G11 TaxID=708437 RepID=A0A9P6TCY2_9BASI|nr:hypothetical protein CROQUDRAFT_91012 [Cronartium quercuum f. sp. fusiforme G11]